MVFVRYFIFCILLVACSSGNKPKKPSKATPPISFKQPVVFARFNSLINSTLQTPSVLHYYVPGSLKEASYCKKSGLFNPETDACAFPSKTTIEVEKHPYPFVWDFSLTPLILFWQQEVEPSQRLTVELLDEAGLPVPASTIVEQNKNLITVTLKPLEPFILGKKLSLIGTLYNFKSDAEQSWIQYLGVGSR